MLFDSGRPASTYGRYDIFSAAPEFTVQYREGVLQWADHPPEHLQGTALVAELQRRLRSYHCEDELPAGLPFRGGLAGYLSYDFGRYLGRDERWLSLPAHAPRDIDLPELDMGFYHWAGIIDHEQESTTLLFTSRCPPKLRQMLVCSLETPVDSNKKFIIINKLEAKTKVDSYYNDVARIKGYIQSGDCYQVNYSQRFSGAYSGDPWTAYKRLRKIMPAPFSAFYQHDDRKSPHDNAILSFSPERFVRVLDRRVTTEPIKGTARRSSDRAQDERSALELVKSDKNRAENLMIVDLLRNDLGKCCVAGSVKVQKLFELQSHSHVHHLVSTIEGRLCEDTGPFELLQAVFPGGSITGAPKLRAVEIIEELEKARRAIYCGAMGYINTDGSMDTNIAIRTLLCHDSQIHCWGGGGIVADSDPVLEYQESLVKIQGLLNALKTMEQGPCLTGSAGDCSP